MDALRQLLPSSSTTSEIHCESDDQSEHLLDLERNAENTAEVSSSTTSQRQRSPFHFLSLPEMVNAMVATIKRKASIWNDGRGDLVGQEEIVDRNNISEMENGDERWAEQFDQLAVSEIKGREGHVKDLLRKLIPRGQRSDDALRLISVYNKEATGKTALARSVYDRPDVKRWFACKAWVRVQDDFSVGDVLVSILRQFATRDLKDVDLENKNGLSWMLREYFFKERYLVVLDHVNSLELVMALLTFLTDRHNGSRLVITTRGINDDLCRHFSWWVDPIEVGPLDETNGKELLLQLSNKKKLDGGLLQRVLSCCSSSPAGIRLLGGLLFVTRESHRFEADICSLKEKDSIKNIVFLSYNILTPLLQNRIMYVCQFPREYEIPTRRLLRLWLTESLPVSQRGIREEEIFLELVRRNMIHVVSRGKGHGFAKTCRMPGFIYDFLRPEALKTGFFQAYSKNSQIIAPRIVVGESKIEDRLGESLETQQQSNHTQQNVKQLCSFMSFDTKKIIMTQMGEIDVLLPTNGDKRSSLKVLDLEGVYKPILPKNLGYVFLDLKYLGLRWTCLDELPESVSELPHLETLDVKHTNITKIPLSIWTKKSLCHIYLNEVSFDESFPHLWRLSMSFNKFIPHQWRLSPFSEPPKSFQTLCGILIEGSSPMLDVLSNSTRITKLSLTCPSTVVREVIMRIANLTTLQSLTLKSKDLLGQPSEIILQDMGRLESLCKVYLFGKITGNSLSFLPRRLKSLTLSMSFLTIDQMNALNELKDLIDLRLYAFSYGGTKLIFAPAMFPKLRTLKMWKLHELDSLIVDEGAMPHLEELNIRDCQKLNFIVVLGDRTTLKEVNLAKVGSEATRSLKMTLTPAVITTMQLVPHHSLRGDSK